MLNPEEIRRRIVASLDGEGDGPVAGRSEVEVKDLTGTGDHFEARVVSPRFVGKGMVEQHQLVYAGLQDLLKTGTLHALALKTYSPEQWLRATGGHVPAPNPSHRDPL